VRVRPAYRALQFWHALTAMPPRQPPCDLGPGLCALYGAMPRADRAHGLRTYSRLRAAGPVPADLAAAALLHDVGKARAGIYLWHRVLFVLARGRLPEWLARRPGFAALRAHAENGAALVAAAGGTPRTVELIRRHHDAHAGDDVLAALQAADEES